MSTRQQRESRILGKFLLGFDGTRLPEELRALLSAGLAGVAIFRGNWRTLEELRALTFEVRAAAGGPVLIGSDAEPGGKFALPEPFTQWPNAQELGRLDDRALVERLGRAIGVELRGAGANLCFAPMLDLHVHPESPVTKERSFGGDPHRAGRLGAAIVRGLTEGGVLACAKHFPGHGDARIDPHEDLPVFHGDARRLDSMELVPFAWAIDAGVPMVMTAHILLPEIEPERPASLSRRLLHETLRERMGFSGAILADDIGMGAIRKRYALDDAAVKAIQAGTDLVAICHDWSAVRPAIEGVARAYEQGLFSEIDWEASQQRLEWLRAALAEGERAAGVPSRADAHEQIGCAEHRALTAEIRERIAAAQGS